VRLDLELTLDVDFDMDMDTVKCMYQRNTFRGNSGQLRLDLMHRNFSQISLRRSLN
jgi:hypothetical protein